MPGVDRTRSLVLVNPRAREGAVGERWSELEQELLGALGEKSVEVKFTSAEDHGAAAVRAALRAGTSMVVVVGGDGTVSEAAQGFFDHGAPIAPEAELAVMPAGRGDDFFKTIAGRGLHGSEAVWAKGLEILRSGRPSAMDVGRISFLADGQSDVMRYFINIASFGCPGLIVQRVAGHAGIWGRSRLGRSALTYLLQTAGAIRDYRALRTLVKVDGDVVFDRPLFSGFVLNGRFNAGGVCWSRSARVDDGVLEVVLFEERSPMATLLSLPRLVSGDWAGVPGVSTHKGTQVEIQNGDSAVPSHPFFEIDGDLPEPPGTRGARVELLPGTIRIRRPV